MDEKIQRELKQKKHTPFHTKMLNHCKALVNMSREDMSKYYAKWDSQLEVYKGSRQKDEEDKKACKAGAPSKIVIPLTYAQIQTFVAFAMGLLLQRNTFFELEGTGEEDHKSAKLGESLLDYNLEHNNFCGIILYQFLLDIARFGVGCYKHTWVEETERIWEQQEVKKSIFQNPLQVLGQAFGAKIEPTYAEVAVDRNCYKGNKIVSVSPYNLYPDTRLPLTRYQEGEFCGSEEEMTRVQLKRGEGDGIYAGVDLIEDFTMEIYNRTHGKRRFRGLSTNALATTGRANTKINTVIVTSVQIEIIPNQFKLEDGTLLGTSGKPEKWLVEYANDSRVIRCEPMGYVHNNFTYHIAQFSPDQMETVNESISDLIGHLQSVIDWFINSHITNVRKHIQNRLIVDPAAVEFSDLRDHKPVIRLKPNAANHGIENYIKQLDTSDITRNHLNDVQALMTFVTMTTAISDNIMGQYHTGRRSAREASNTAAASGSRLRNIVKLIYDSAIKPSGRDMLSNLRDGLDVETFVTVAGDTMEDWQAYKHFILPDGRVKVGMDRKNLAGKFDFKVFEGILPSDKYAQAETIEQTLLAMLRNPEGVPMLTQFLGYDPQKLLTEALELRGVKNPARFKITQFRQMELQNSLQEQQLQEQLNQQNDATGGVMGAGAGALQTGQPTGQIQGLSGAMQSLIG